jgi:hypothetical protein
VGVLDARWQLVELRHLQSRVTGLFSTCRTKTKDSPILRMFTTFFKEIVSTNGKGSDKVTYQGFEHIWEDDQHQQSTV